MRAEERDGDDGVTLIIFHLTRIIMMYISHIVPCLVYIIFIIFSNGELEHIYTFITNGEESINKFSLEVQLSVSKGCLTLMTS